MPLVFFSCKFGVNYLVLVNELKGEQKRVKCHWNWHFGFVINDIIVCVVVACHGNAIVFIVFSGGLWTNERWFTTTTQLCTCDFWHMSYRIVYVWIFIIDFFLCSNSDTSSFYLDPFTCKENWKNRAKPKKLATYYLTEVKHVLYLMILYLQIVHMSYTTLLSYTKHTPKVYQTYTK